MSTGAAYQFYKSSQWERVRELAMRRVVTLPDGRICPPGMCERCFERGQIQPAEIVHHIKHVTPQNVHDPHVTLNPDNLMRVCRVCHAEIHYPNDYKPRVSFDSSGRVIRRG